MKHISFISILSAGLYLTASAIFTGCTSPEGKGEDDHATYSAKGSIQKGPFIQGSTIAIQALDDQLNPTGKSYSTVTTNDFGDYEIGSEIESNYAEIIAQGYYFNECTGRISDAPITLRSITDLSKKGADNVNILTTLSYERIRRLIRQGADFKEAKKQAESEVLAVFGITGATEGFEKLDLAGAASGDAILAAVSVMLQSGRSEGELSELYSKISADIASGGSSSGHGYESYRYTIDPVGITNNLMNQYGTVPDFLQYLDMNGDGVPGDKYFFMDANDIRVQSTGGTYTLNYMADGIGSATIPGGESWIRVVGTKSIAPHTVTISVDANMTPRPRSATLKVSNADNTAYKNVTVNQDPFTDAITIEHGDGAYWVDYLHMIPKVTIKGKMTHEELQLAAQMINATFLDMSQMETEDGVVGLQECFYVDGEVRLPVVIDTIYSNLLRSSHGIDITNWMSTKAVSLAINDYGSDVTFVYGGLFNGAWRPKNLTLPASVKEIHGPLFCVWDDLESVDFHDGIDLSDAIGLFGYCRKLQKVRFPSDLKSIPDYAFSYTPMLEDIVMPTVDEINFGYQWFFCDHERPADYPLPTVDLRPYRKVTFSGGPDYLGSGVKWYGHEGPIYQVDVPSDAFNTITSSIGDAIVELYCNDGIVESKTFRNKIPDNYKIVALHLGPNVRYMDGPLNLYPVYDVTYDNPAIVFGEQAFRNMQLRHLIEIPLGMTEIPAGCFADSYISGGNPIDHRGPIGTPWTLNIPSHIKTIGFGAFYNSDRIQEVVLPSNVTKVGDGAFESCHELRKITFSPSMTEIPLGCCRFDASLSSDNIIIPQNIRRIGIGAFAGCDIRSLDFLPSSLDEYPFNALGDYRQSRIDVPEGVKTVSELYDVKIDTVVLPSSLSELDPNFCAFNRTIQDIEFKNGLTTIGLRSFVGAPKLKTVTLPSSITDIQADFYGNPDNAAAFDIYLMNTVPPKVDFLFFDPGNTVITFHVPKAALAAYRNHPEWSAVASNIKGF